jgi:hypothetical protein
MAAGVRNHALIENICSTNALTIRASLQWMNAKANSLDAVTGERFEKKCVQRRRPRTSIHFAFDSRNSKLGQANPLAPA